MCCGNAGQARTIRPRDFDSDVMKANSHPAHDAHDAIEKMARENAELRRELERTQIALAKYVTASHAQ